MNAEQLRAVLNENKHPATFIVDADTYRKAEIAIYTWAKERPRPYSVEGYVLIAHGPNGGLMFKGVELLLEVTGTFHPEVTGG